MNGWFRPVSARPLAALRVGLSLLLLVHLIWISGDLLALHGSRGIVPWELANLERDPWVPGLPTLARALSPLGISEQTAIVMLLAGYAGSLLSLALGFHARVSAILAWGLHVCIMTSGYASYYGVDQIAKTFLFYLVLFPSDRAWTFVRHRASNEQTIPVLYLRVLRAHLCVIYLAAGLHKARGAQWWTGEAIWQTVNQPIFGTFDLRWMASHSWVPMLAGWITLAIEIGYPFFVWPRRTRTAWCFATIGLHVGLALFMGLVFFSGLMILLTTCFFLVPEEVRETAPVRRPVLATLLVFGLLFCAPRQARAADTARFDDYPSMVRRLMARDHVPGVAVGVVERGSLVVARGFGVRDLERRQPVTPDTLFPIGSCSKAFTATALALLADEGKLDLDAPIRTYLPDFELEDPSASATLTTRDILTHRSGLPRHDLFWYEAPFSRDELYQRLRFLEPSGPPRAQWRYNSLMFVVAGRVIERVSGESWERFVEARILAPLGMDRTVLTAPAMETDRDHASPYALRDGRVRRMFAHERSNAMAPAGGVATSVRDLAHWLAFHMTRSPPIVGPRWWDELHAPRAEMPAATEPEIADPHYALGWVHERYRGHPLVFHNGAVDGFTVHLGFLPETGQGVILLMNRDLASSALMALAYGAYDRLLGLEPIDWESRLVEAPTELEDVKASALDFSLQSVVGRYEHPAYGAISVVVERSELAIRFRTHRATLAYQGQRRFLTREPIAEGAPQITVRFSDESQQLFVPLNFDEGDPVEVFTRVK